MRKSFTSIIFYASYQVQPQETVWFMCYLMIINPWPFIMHEFNPFNATGLFQYPVKTKNQSFSVVFRGYWKRLVTWNGLIITKNYLKPKYVKLTCPLTINQKVHSSSLTRCFKDIEKCVTTIRKNFFFLRNVLKNWKKMVSTCRNMIHL